MSFSALLKVLGSVPVQLLPQGWNSSGFGIHVQLPRLHIIHLTSLHRVSVATAAGLSDHSWTHCYILFECRIVWRIKMHCFTTCVCMSWLYVTELCSGITGILPVDRDALNKAREGESLAHSDIDEIMAVFKMHLYCLMKVSRVLDVRTTAWAIKLLWGRQASWEGHRESLRKYGWTDLNSSKSVHLHTFSLWTLC